MRKFLRKVSLVSAAGMLASGIALADIDMSNENTGSDSTNENTVDVDQTIDEDVTNSADIDNDVDADLDTGDNEANDNTGGGDVDSGDADIDGELENEVNSATVSFYTAVFGDVDGELENNTTGSDSENENDLDVSQSIDVDLDNTADLLNTLDLEADTGHNEANDNTGGGDIASGDAGIGVGIMNMLNVISSSIGSFGDVNVGLANRTTGSDSTNTNDVDVTQDITIHVTNDATVDNTVTSEVDTGDNEANDNTGGGKVRTGKASADTEISNKINTGGSSYNVTLPDVDVEAENNKTGSDSTNTNDVTVDNSATIDVSNDATIDNTVDSEADTGDNEANDNTGGGDISTGDASVSFSISNTVNN